MRALAGPLLAAAVLVLDQLTKTAILSLGPGRLPIEVTSFFNLVLVWNPGVTFGMLGDAPESWRLGLIGVTLVIVVVLAVWLAREPRLLPRLAIWSILAGATGNLIDRLRFGAVVDFLDLHLGGYHWPAFNVADSAIVVGAMLLILDSLVLQPRAAVNAKEGNR